MREISKEKIMEIMRLVVGKFPLPRIFLISKTEHVAIGDDFIIFRKNNDLISNELNDLDFESPSRGELLDLFTRFEFIFDEMLKISMATKNKDMLQSILNTMSLSSKIKLLLDYRILDKKYTRHLSKMRKARNKIAHSMGGSLGVSDAKAFKKDLIELWTYTLDKYEEIQPTFEEIINELKELEKKGKN